MSNGIWVGKGPNFRNSPYPAESLWPLVLLLRAASESEGRGRLALSKLNGRTFDSLAANRNQIQFRYNS